jgi:predicted DCC family thiol-disulfide oxidoreductase YuxK
MGARSETGAAAAVSGPVLLFDGECGFCSSSVQFVLHRDRAPHRRAQPLRFAPLQGRHGQSILSRHPELAHVDSLVWVEEDRLLVKSDAALRVAAYLGGAWAVGSAVGRMVPRPWRDRVYDLIARHRHQLVGETGGCAVPTEGERGRFLE